MHLDSINQCSCILLAYMVINVFRVLQSCIKHCHSSLLIFVLMLSPASLHWVPILCWGVLCYHKPHLSPPPLSLSLFGLTSRPFIWPLTCSWPMRNLWAILQSTNHSLLPTHLVPQSCWAGQSCSRGRHCKSKKVVLYKIYISVANGVQK